MSLTANSAGEIVGKFTIPENSAAGSKLVEFAGAGTTASATFVGRGVLTVDELRTVNTVVNRRLLTWKGDPLAQTFTLSRRTQIAGIDLWFEAIGPTNLIIQIRDVQNGLPTADVLGETVLTPAQAQALQAAGPNGAVRCPWTPTLLDADREYCVVVGCNDAVAALETAAIGEFDVVAQKWVTEQPYQIGVLLSSSNNRTWTAHQTKDLRFRLLSADYAAGANTVSGDTLSRTVALDDVEVVDADHFVVMAAVERHDAACEVVFHLTIDGITYSVVEGQPATLPERFTGTVSIEAELIGTAQMSPVLHRDIHVITGKRLPESDYVTRAFTCDGGTSLTVYLNVLLPGLATVDVYYEADDASWVAIPVVSGIELGNGWQEIKYSVACPDQAETRVKIVMAGSAVARPRVRSLRAVVI